MRWGRKRSQEENSTTEEKSFSLSHLLSFPWLSKLRSITKPPNNTSPKCPSSKLECCSKDPIPNSKHNPPSLHRQLSIDQPPTPRRRSNCHRRNHSVGSLTLGHVIPFSIVSKQNQHSPPMSGLYRSVSDPGLPPRKTRRRRKFKSRLIVAASDDTRRKSFSGRIKSRRHNRAGARSPRLGRRKGLENFAVVKKSSEPERDFKESMVEMILEKRIGRPEELESLLACYLALNSDEHHDVIVKVFRQVWFEINPDRFGAQRLSPS